jgi:hypothetical protein
VSSVDPKSSFGLFLEPGPLSLLQSAQVDSVNPGDAQLAYVRRFLFSSRPEVLASFVPRDVWPLWIVATPPVELAARTKILQLDGLASTASAATSSLKLPGAIVAQEVRPVIPGLAPKSPAVVGAFNKIDTEWPDEMSPQRLQEYKAKVAEFRQRLKV